MIQMDLFEWADSRPSNVIDAVPALVRRACQEARRKPQAGEAAKVIPLLVRAA